MEKYKKPYSDAISKMVDDLTRDRAAIRVLEAGCGSASYVTFHKKAEIVGIDVSKEQLEKNSYIQEKILGDIQTYALPSGEFDVVICSDVLEHVPNPMLALKNILGTIKTNGVLILAFPNVMSLKGLATKWTPFWFHKAYYKYIGIKKDPFPTFLRFSMRPLEISRVAVQNGYSVELYKIYDGISQRLKKKFGIFVLFRSLSFVLMCLTLGRVDFTLSECILVFQKKATV